MGIGEIIGWVIAAYGAYSSAQAAKKAPQLPKQVQAAKSPTASYFRERNKGPTTTAAAPSSTLLTSQANNRIGENSLLGA